MGTQRNDRNIVEAAAAWSVRLDAGDLSPAENLALSEWLRESPRHVEELLMTGAVLAAAGGIDQERQIDVQALIERASTTVVDLTDSGKPSPAVAEESTRRTRFAHARLKTYGMAAGAFAAMAASVYLVVGTPILTGPADSGESYVTQLGEQRSLTLPDGSVIHINTHSQLDVRFTKSLRTLTLVSGEAMFEVAHDPKRPFRVLAGEAVVQAIGTEFNVYRQTDRTDVTVIEGKVAILAESELESMPRGDSALFSDSVPVADATPGSTNAPAAKQAVMLTVGQEARVTEDGTVERVSSVDPALRTSWLRRMLIFRNEPLSHVVREFNRYNGLQIRIDDPELARTPLTVALRADNPQALLELLATSENIVIERNGSTEIVVRRSPAQEII